jgi:hypothetical protein
MTTEMDNEFGKAPNRPQKLIREVRVPAEKIEKSVEAQTLALDRAQKNLVNVYKNEKKIAVRVAPSYAKYFGRVMRVSINGISVAVRCDGRDTLLPESFAAEVLRRMSEMDKYDLRLNKMADVPRNLETSPGQISFFG